VLGHGLSGRAFATTAVRYPRERDVQRDRKLLPVPACDRQTKTEV